MDEIFDKWMTDMMENKLATLLDEKYHNLINHAVTERFKQNDTAKHIQQLRETVQQAENIRTEIYTMQSEGHTEALRHKALITTSTDNAKISMEEHSHDTRDKIKSKTDLSLQMIQNRVDLCSTSLTITKDNALLAIAAHQDKANKEIRQQSQSEQSTNKQLVNLNNAVADAIASIHQEAEQIKRELQSDKDRYSQSLLNDKSRHIETIQHKTDEALEHLHTAAKTHQATATQDETQTHSQYQRNSQATYNTQDHPYDDDHQYDFVNLVAQRDEEQRQEQQEQDIHEHSRRIEDKIHRFRSAQLEHYLSNKPTQEEVERLYRAIASEMRACHMPIVPFNELTPTSGTKPTDVELTPTVAELVNRELYVQLIRAIPHGATSLRDIL
jgi:hypothetical protein